MPMTTQKIVVSDVLVLEKEAATTQTWIDIFPRTQGEIFCSGDEGNRKIEIDMEGIVVTESYSLKEESNKVWRTPKSWTKSFKGIETFGSNALMNNRHYSTGCNTSDGGAGAGPRIGCFWLPC